MTVSDKKLDMVEALYDLNSDFLQHSVETLTEAIDAVINAAWTRFDPEDESTYPKSSLAPSGMPWLVENHEQGAEHPEIGCDEWLVRDKDWLMCFDAIRYADPATLTPEKE